MAVIVPMHNRAHCVVAALDSIVAQTHRPQQLIVVDNASTDSSYDVVQRWMEQRKMARQKEESGLLQEDVKGGSIEMLLLSAKTPGASAARNVGLNAVWSEWVSFFDSDDIMSHDFLERMLTAATTQARDWCTTRSCMCFPDGKRQTRWSKPQPTLSEQLLGACITTQTFVARTALVRHVGGWDEDLKVWNDYELGFRLLLADPHPAWCDGTFHELQQHAASITGTSYAAQVPSLAQALQHLAQSWQQHAKHYPVPQQKATWRALFLRIHIVKGRLLREGAPKAARQLGESLHPALPDFPWWTIIMARLLQTYVRCGGRGAWRIARCLC